ITLKSVEPNAQFAAGSHLLGTAPIGTDPDDSFAGPTGEAHRVANLYVADGAAVPGSISVDPSLTIMGFARWIAAGLHDRAGRAGSGAQWARRRFLRRALAHPCRSRPDAAHCPSAAAAPPASRLPAADPAHGRGAHATAGAGTGIIIGDCGHRA